MVLNYKNRKNILSTNIFYLRRNNFAKNFTIASNLNKKLTIKKTNKSYKNQKIKTKGRNIRRSSILRTYNSSCSVVAAGFDAKKDQIISSISSCVLMNETGSRRVAQHGIGMRNERRPFVLCFSFFRLQML